MNNAAIKALRKGMKVETNLGTGVVTKVYSNGLVIVRRDRDGYVDTYRAEWLTPTAH